ncbi:MAG TPA: SDR family NAD(P)-dependent oxidoreductase [Candidatus Angelobacter sp.]|nr:SDR family NAD(P)-dependent oxidoreductase [Candidatus Angelobacter sp.]
MKIQGKSALVTGGASGLGAATVRTLAAAGAKVVIADINEALGRQLAGESGNSVSFIKTDVTKEEEVRAAVDEAVKIHGGLHIAVAAAGIGIAEKLIGKNGIHDLQNFNRVLQVNLIGTFDVIRRAAQAMTANQPDEGGGRGVIVATASVAAFEGQVGQLAYCASKGGIVSMTLPLARELSRHGIRMVTIAPGIFETPLLGTLSKEIVDALSEQVPFPKRLGQPLEYASLARHIIENDMLNGSVIRLDGAIRMAAK